MVYKKLDFLIRNRQFSFEDFFKQIGLSKTGYYSMIKQKNIRVEVLERIAAFFNVPVSYFFEDGEEKKTIVEGSNFTYGKSLQQRLLECWDDKKIITDENRDLYKQLLSSEKEKVQMLKEYAIVKAK